MKKWFNLDWYLYLFEFDNGYYSFSDKLKVITCRIKGHPNGPIWYSNGFEPNMQCKDCGDEL